VSTLIRATTVPGSKTFDARAHLWSTKTDVALRLPWALLGMADPSSRQAIKVDTEGAISAVPIDHIGLTYDGAGKTIESSITWEPWQTTRSRERTKDGLALFSKAVGDVLSRK